MHGTDRVMSLDAIQFMELVYLAKQDIVPGMTPSDVLSVARLTGYAGDVGRLIVTARFGLKAPLDLLTRCHRDARDVLKVAGRHDLAIGLAP